MIRMVTKLESALESILLIMSGVAQPGSAPALGARLIYSNRSILFFDFYCFQQFGESALRSKLTQMV